jgi:hypothetical protein
VVAIVGAGAVAQAATAAPVDAPAVVEVRANAPDGEVE